MSKKSKRRKEAAAARLAASRTPTGARANNSNINKNRKTKGGAALSEGVKRPTRRTLIVTVAVLLVVALLTSLTVLLVSHLTRRLDFLEDNLPLYLTVPDDSYRGLTFTTDEPPVTDRDVEFEIVKLLAANKGEAEYSGERRRWIDVSAGDMIEIYYRGYRIDGGVRDYFSGGCNLADLIADRTQADIEAAYLEVGSGKLLFESELVGVNARDFATLSALETGTVEEGDILYITYSVITPTNDNPTAQTAYLDLTTDEAERLFGAGFDSFLVGKPIGRLLSESFVASGAEGDSVYYDITVNGAFRRTDAETLTVETRFPDSYQEESLRGVSAYFDIYIMGGIEYSTPDFDESFIYGTLKESEDSLKEYSGEGAVEKYRSKLERELLAARADRIDALAVEFIWDSLLSAVKIKKLPRREAQVFYDGYIEQLEEEFAYYESYYTDFSQFVRQVYSLTEGESWEEHLWGLAEDALVEKLVFYTVARRERLYPTDPACVKREEEMREQIIAEYLEYVGCTPDKYDTAEEYEIAKAIRVADLMSYYGEDYFSTEAYYEYVMERLLTYVTVVETK